MLIPSPEGQLGNCGRKSASEKMAAFVRRREKSSMSSGGTALERILIASVGHQPCIVAGSSWRWKQSLRKPRAHAA